MWQNSTLSSTTSNPTTQQSLQGAALQRLQLTWKHKHYIIIDEMSMLGQRMMAWIDKRLRQATGKLGSPLGGVSVILVGDFAQLPPVRDRPLFAEPSTNELSIHGYYIYCTFDTVVFLQQVIRQNGSDPRSERFRQLLFQLRNGNITQEDWHLLLEHDPQKAQNQQGFADAVRLFYDKASVAQYNLNRLQALNEPVARINAKHSSSAAASTSPDEAGGLHSVVFLASGAHVMLTCNLWQEVGLCNGAAGKVYHLLYRDGQQPPDLPIAVLVDFNVYEGPPFLPDRPKCIPIPPVTFEWNTGHQTLSHANKSHFYSGMLLRFIKARDKHYLRQSLTWANLNLLLVPPLSPFHAFLTLTAVSSTR